MYKGYIYRHWIVNDKNVETSYIGQTIEVPQKRWKNGKGYAPQKNKKPSEFYNAICKYGWDNFKHEIIGIAEAETKEQLKLDLNEWEKYYIEKYDSFYNGYNGTTGGDSFFIMTEEVKRKMSSSQKASMTDEKREHLKKINTGESNPFYGKTHTEETKQLYRDLWKERKASGDYHPANYGTKMSEEQRAKLSKTKKEKIKNMTEDERRSIAKHLINSPMTEERKRKIGEKSREYWTEEKKKAKSEAMKGKTITDEQRQKLKESCKKRSENSEYIEKIKYASAKKVRCITNGMVFLSLKEAGQWCIENIGGTTKSSNKISLCCKGKLETYGVCPQTGEKLKWEYLVEK